MVQTTRHTTHKNTVSKDEQAVSAVIGVILMIAVTVILAAVIGAFVFNYAPNLLPSQGAQPFAFTQNDDGSLTVINNGGVTAKNVTVQMNGYTFGELFDPAPANETVAFASLQKVGGQIDLCKGTTATADKDMKVTVSGEINGNRVVLSTYVIK